jgi:tripartite-type tricarboxylate transporter receptor subunit TctC
VVQNASKYFSKTPIVSVNRAGASGAIAAIQLSAETEKYVREQFELYDKLVTALGIRQ